MKYIKLIIVFVAFGLVSCANPVADKPTGKKYVTVLNSEWKIVIQEEANISRGIESTDAIEAQVEQYNASHIDDQWFIYGEEYPDLENAPPCSIYIVDRVTHDPLFDSLGNPFSYTNWPRKQLVDNKEGWKKYAESCGADIYIDVIPPAPSPDTEDQLYAKYSFYAIDSTGAIMYQDHGYPLIDGWPSLEYWQTVQQSRYQLIVASPENANVPWTYIMGRVYTAP